MKALIVIDFINEIVDEEGKLSGKGYTTFIKDNDTFRHVNNAIATFRKAGKPVIFVRLAFDPSYSNQPKGSPLFGKANEFGILADGSWSTEIHSRIDVQESDSVVTKTRVSAFHNTDLMDVLTKHKVDHVYIAGVATDLAVEATARSAHDNDFTVSVIADACAAANSEDHNKALAFLSKISTVVNMEDIAV